MLLEDELCNALPRAAGAASVLAGIEPMTAARKLPRITKYRSCTNYAPFAGAWAQHYAMPRCRLMHFCTESVALTWINLGSGGLM